MSPARTTSGRYFADTLKGYGITHLFYVPFVLESALKPLNDAGIIRVMAHHEVAAAFMADGYARAGHRPGVCMAQQVGAANMAAGLRDAFLASTPIVCVTGGTHPDSHYQYLYQVLEDYDMYRAVTKFNAKVETPSRMPDLLRQAIREAMSGTPGPTHLELPGRTGEGAEGSIDADVIVEPQFARLPPYRQRADSPRIEQAARLLAAAERPVIVAGGGVVASAAETEVVKLAEILSIPVATSGTGKGTILEDHPLSLGVMGSYGRRPVNQAVKESDLVFFVGSRAGDMTTDHYSAPPKGIRVIQLDINPAEIGRVYPAEVALAGDAKVTLQRMIEMAQPNADTGPWVRRTQKLRDEWLAEQEALGGCDDGTIRPERLCWAISEFLPEGGVVVADTGHAGVWTSTMVRLTRLGQRFIRSFGTLGWAFPASLGVQCALPGQTVVCFTGDGGMYYHMCELETAARYGIPAIVVVNNNSAFSQVKGALEIQNDCVTDLGKPEECYSFGHIDFARIASDMGCLGIRVETPDDLRPALEKAAAARKPTVIDVVTDIEAMPAWS